MERKIISILQFIDYEFYKNITSDDDLQFFKYQFRAPELFEILSASNEVEFLKIQKYYAKVKSRSYNSYIEKLQSKTNLKSEKAKKFPDGFHTGIWHKNELLYGLWHNSLFTKWKYSALSTIYNKRLTSLSLMKSNPRIWIDLDFLPDNFFYLRYGLNNVRKLLAYNKYKLKQPYIIEFIRTRKSELFDRNVHRILTWWHQPEHYQYVVHGKRPTELIDQSKKLIYLSPTASQAITRNDLLNESNILVFPAYNSPSLRDPVYNNINKLSSKEIKVRRLPTVEHIVWNKFHGVIPLEIILAILYDITNDATENWVKVFQKYLLEKELIKSDEEIKNIDKIRSQTRIKRQANINEFIKSKW